MSTVQAPLGLAVTDEDNSRHGGVAVLFPHSDDRFATWNQGDAKEGAELDSDRGRVRSLLRGNKVDITSVFDLFFHFKVLSLSRCDCILVFT